MPVSVITDVVTWIEMIAQIGVSTLELGVMSYLVFGGGWLDMIRLISFWLDNMIIKYTDVFYSYFEKILGGKIFAPDVVDGVMSKVYIFVSLIVLLKIMMLFVKYLINPEMVSDDKIGTHALVKRVLLGMCGMIALPYIFSFSVDVQEAVLNDNLFGQILLTKKELRTFEKNKGQVGRVLAFNVYQAFWNLDTNRVTSSAIKKEYNNAITAKDPGVIGSINEKFGEDYAYDYFPIASTVVLLYVIYLIIKYCLDVVVRMFKLFLLQMLGPLAISDYMINGDSKGVFKNWLNTTLSVYAMLFVRIFSIWFIAFITILMQKECTTAGADGICTDSLLYVIKGQDPDYLLRGIITLGLLALLMDLPKFFSDILGLDLEQDATVKGLMQKVGGAAKMVGLGAATMGGAALGSAIGGGKAVLGATKFGQNLNKSKEKFAEKHGVMTAMSGAAKANRHGMFAAAMSTNSLTGSIQKGYQGTKQEQDKSGSESTALTKATKQDREKQQAQELQEAQLASLNTIKDANGNIVAATQNVTPDQQAMAQFAGMMQGMAAANQNNQTSNQTSQTAQAGKTTVEVNDIEVKVTGKAVANYDGGLETNITGKATTTYNGDLETVITGNATASYNQDLNVEVNGNATASYNKDLNVEVQGNANATLNKDINVDVQGNTTAIFDGNVDTLVTGNATATFDGDVDTMISGNTTSIVEGGSETLIERKTTVELNDVEIKKNNNSNNA